MGGELDHYTLLGLPSGEEGANLSEKEITKAYKKKVLELHPDKRPNDPNAHPNFLQLGASYKILKDEKERKKFDDRLRFKRNKSVHQSQQGSKRRKMMSDLDKREKAAYAPDPVTKAQEEEERITRKFHEEISKIRAERANKVASTTSWRAESAAVGGRESKGGGSSGLDKEKVLKVYWEKIGEDLTAQRLKELFEKFGEIEDVVIKSSKKRGSALIVMVSKDAAVAAIGGVHGDPSNPFLVLPLDAAAFSRPFKNAEPEGGHQPFENVVLKKMMQKF